VIIGPKSYQFDDHFLEPTHTFFAIFAPKIAETLAP
jgi:hypothetical protein